MKNPATDTRLLLLRHAEVEEKHHHLFGGRVDMNLSALGQQQAAALAQYVHTHEPLHALYASPMKRVQQTLVPLLALGAPAPVVDRDLREMDFGDWTGRKWVDISAEHNLPAALWLDTLARGAVPNAEPEAVVRARVEPVLRRAIQAHPGQTVAIACHGVIVRQILAIALGLTLGQLGSFEVEYASVTTLEARRDRMILKHLNHVPWKA